MAFLNFHKDLVHSKLAFTIISSLLGNVKVEQQDKTYSFYGSIISVVGNSTANLIGLFECRKTY